MPLGSVLRSQYKSPMKRVYCGLFGVADLHSHIRWKAIKGYLDTNCERTAEIGGGWGLMSIEFAKISNRSIDCIEINPQQVTIGKTLSAEIGVQINFVQDFLPSLTKLGKNKYNQILLIDVLEHVHADLESLIRINRLLVADGQLIISVPTPNYPKVFGEETATNIGHVRDGYTIKSLQDLLSRAGFTSINWRYHTNSLSSFLCSLWYKKHYPKAFKIALFPFFMVLTALDPIDRKTNSCGIVIKALKVNEL